MGSMFYELYDAYLAAWKAVRCDPMPEAVVQKCRLAGEVQHQFLDYGDRSQNCLDKLLGFLETDCIPVRCCFCMSKAVSGCCNCLVSIAAILLPFSGEDVAMDLLELYCLLGCTLHVTVPDRVSFTPPAIVLTFLSC